MSTDDQVLHALHSATGAPGKGRKFLAGAAAATIPILGYAGVKGYQHLKKRKEPAVPQEQAQAIEKQAQYDVLRAYGFVKEAGAGQGLRGALRGGLTRGLQGAVLGAALGGGLGYATADDPSQRGASALRGAGAGAALLGLGGASVGGAFGVRDGRAAEAARHTLEEYLELKQLAKQVPSMTDEQLRAHARRYGGNKITIPEMNRRGL